MRPLSLDAVAVTFLLASSFAFASDTPAPAAVTIAGTLQSELGCSGDWQPDCAHTHLIYDAEDEVWQQSFSLPAGTWEYKAALDDSWTENYGANAARDGANIPLSLDAAATVKFYYDHETHWVTSSRNSVVVTVAGSFQSELGCSSDWNPGCLRSWLEDPNGDGVYEREALLPAGSYEAKVAIDESWAENYGAGGVRDGPNIPFTVGDATIPVVFRYDAATHLLTITGGAPEPPVDLDGDSVPDDEDACPSTVIPEAVPTVRLKANHYALVDGDLTFDTVTRGRAAPAQLTVRDTGGCSCEQIIAQLGLGAGQEQFGCSLDTLQSWIARISAP
jgi:hypothetical protein